MTPANWFARASGYPGDLAASANMVTNGWELKHSVPIPPDSHQRVASLPGLGGKSGSREVISIRTDSIPLAAWLLIPSLLLILQTIHYPLGIWQMWTWPTSKPNDEIQVRRSGRKKRKYKDEPDGFPTCKDVLYLPGRLQKPSSVPVVCLLLGAWVMFGANRSMLPLTSIWWLAYCLEPTRDDLVLWRKLARKFNSIKRNARSGYGFLFWVKAEKGVRNSNPEGQDGLQDLLNHIWNMFPMLLSPPCSYNWPTGITQLALILFHMWLFLIRRLYLIFSCTMSSLPIQVSNSIS